MATTTTPSAPSQAEASPEQRGFADALKTRMSDSQLPGEPPLTGERLDRAAAFVIEAALEREDGKPSILISSETEARAGARRYMRIAIINKDMPFLIDSIAATLASRNLAIEMLVHPIVPVRRSATRLTAIPEGAGAGEKLESWVYLETPRVDAKERRALEQELQAAILDVRAAVADWAAMRDVILADADGLADPEGAALLRWFGGGMLTQLGHLVRTRDGAVTGELGICRRSTPDLLAEDAYAKAFAWFDRAEGAPGRSPLVIKANRIAKVHRRVPLDLIIVPRYEAGRVAALSVHAGMWTSAALATPPETVPVLRTMLKTIMERLGVAVGGHDYKGLVHALVALPHDLVVGFSDEAIIEVATAMVALADRPRPRAALVAAPLGRHIFGFVWIPRDLLSTNARLQIQALLEQHTRATTIDWGLTVEGGNLAMLRFVLDSRGQSDEIDLAAIDDALQDMLRGWGAAVEEALGATEDESRAAALAMRFAASFPAFYRSHYGAAEAAVDIGRLRKLSIETEADGSDRDVRLYCTDETCAANNLRLKVYLRGGALPLSDAVPALENFGFRVLSELPTELTGADPATIHDFTLGLAPGLEPETVLERATTIENAIACVLNARAEDDLFNRLVVVSALEAQEADWLRAFYRYLRQSNIAFTIHTVVDALAGAPKVTRGLIALFRQRHDPAYEGSREAATAEALDAIRAGLADVGAINDDRLLRLYRETILAIVRTNAFAPAGAEALAFKFNSSLVPGLPRPVPWREIFVYSRRVEGIHLRAGPVARGGLRWSDRRDDFRTEVLGLMKAQRVKNAVIVPTGAKGGFYPKRLPNPAVDRDAWANEGRESYKLFILTLLSLTDNIVDDQVVHPDKVVIHDGEDPYFVVAADKGTASFSDTANAIALEHDFWLGDAFASGGSNGYDHKAMGITARGAWLSVQRHFQELGVDVQTDPVRVVGCGDMSGDVFGNGMLLSRSLKLIAAFDHRHIFIDPDPDPAASWAERQRLFDLPRSSWADYEAGLISQGGGVYPRTEKRIELSEVALAALGIAPEALNDGALDPDSLISAILRSPVDLVWFGGIGTYVKAEHESNADVGDPVNDTLRINGEEVRARVIGEGANLGVTQAGRIEFALEGAQGAGGRINTDFIDNSAGVDCSDNEVNIKIALAAARRAGLLTEERRNALLHEMTEDVAALVLEDNRLQALALSIAERGGAQAMGAYVRLIDALEEVGGLDRRTDGLGDNEALARRAAEGHGLTRPELAVLLSSAKLVLQAAVENGTLAQDEAADALVLGDFPAQMQEHYREQLLHHRLRAELVGTAVANRMVNRMGMIHPFELAEEEGAGLETVGAAFVAATSLLGMDRLWTALENTPMPEEARLELFDRAALALRGHMADLLRATGGLVEPARLVRDIGPVIDELAGKAEALLGAEARGHVGAIAARLIEQQAPEDLANEVARLFALDGAIGLALLARETGIAPVALAHGFIELGAMLGIDWAQSQAAVMSPADPWERLLVSGIARDFQQMRLQFLRRLTTRGGTGTDGAAADSTALDSTSAAIDAWEQRNAAPIEQVRRVIARAQKAALIAPAMLAQIASQARNLLNG